MRRAGTSTYALTLVKPRTTEVVEVEGRDRILRRGIYFALVGKHRRSVYQQLDGKLELADLCSCKTDWTPDFGVIRSVGCPIDEHKREAMDDEWGVA